MSLTMYAWVFSAEDLPARINSRLLSQYKGQTVRLTAKVLKLSGDTATVQASDGGEVSRSTEWEEVRLQIRLVFIYRVYVPYDQARQT